MISDLLPWLAKPLSISLTCSPHQPGSPAHNLKGAFAQLVRVTGFANHLTGQSPMGWDSCRSSTLCLSLCKERPGACSLSERGTMVEGGSTSLKMSNLSINKLKGKENKSLSHIYRQPAPFNTKIQPIIQ